MIEITVKQLEKLIQDAITCKYIIDLKVSNEMLVDLEPFGLYKDNRVLRCYKKYEVVEIYLSNVTFIRIYDNNNKLDFEADIIQKLINSLKKLTKKELENEIMLLRNLLNSKDTKIVELNKKIDDLKKSNAELKDSIKEMPKNKTGRKPYNNTKVIEIIRNLRLEGNGYLEIANRLNSMNLLTDKNKLWGASSIKCIIKRYIEKS